jgi:predicted DNA-binding antitoxin AbrB/MazE fold protein
LVYNSIIIGKSFISNGTESQFKGKIREVIAMAAKPATIRARFKNGIIEPLENVELRDGEEIVLTIVRRPETNGTQDAFRKSRGGWKDLIDCEKLKRDIYESRSIQTRPEVKL